MTMKRLFVFSFEVVVLPADVYKLLAIGGNTSVFFMWRAYRICSN